MRLIKKAAVFQFGHDIPDHRGADADWMMRRQLLRADGTGRDDKLVNCSKEKRMLPLVQRSVSILGCHFRQVRVSDPNSGSRSTPTATPVNNFVTHAAYYSSINARHYSTCS
jgi:hypothetical protein